MWTFLLQYFPTLFSSSFHVIKSSHYESHYSRRKTPERWRPRWRTNGSGAAEGRKVKKEVLWEHQHSVWPFSFWLCPLSTTFSTTSHPSSASTITLIINNAKALATKIFRLLFTQPDSSDSLTNSICCVHKSAIKSLNTNKMQSIPLAHQRQDQEALASPHQ